MDKKKLLLVEDEAIIALELKTRLQMMGDYVVQVVPTGHEALAMMEEYHPDLILMDMMLRGEMDGIETSTRIRENHETPVIYMTGNSHLKTDPRIEETKPYWFLVKPVPDFKLVELIREALDSRQN